MQNNTHDTFKSERPTHETEPQFWCTCIECEEKRQNEMKHLSHQFYRDAHNYREQVRREQILKGAAKYPEPFNPDSWTAQELLQHAMQENVDQGHYISGLAEKVQAIEKELASYKKLNGILQADNDVLSEKLEHKDGVIYALQYTIGSLCKAIEQTKKGETNETRTK